MVPYAALVQRVNLFRTVTAKNKTGFGLVNSTYEKTLNYATKKITRAQLKEIGPHFKIK